MVTASSLSRYAYRLVIARWQGLLHLATILAMCYRTMATMVRRNLHEWRFTTYGHFARRNADFEVELKSYPTSGA